MYHRNGISYFSGLNRAFVGADATTTTTNTVKTDQDPDKNKIVYIALGGLALFLVGTAVQVAQSK